MAGTLTILAEVFCGFPQSCQAVLHYGMLKICNYNFLFMFSDLMRGAFPSHLTLLALITVYVLGANDYLSMLLKLEWNMNK